MTLFMKFELGGDGYLLDAAQVAQVLPLVGIKGIPHAARGIAGACNYRGVSIPVIDLVELATGERARRNFSTRMILVRYPDGAGCEQLLALIAEKVTQTVKYEPAQFAAAGVASRAAPYLGSVCADGGRLLQQIDVRQLLPIDVREVLFRQAKEDSWSLESKRC